MTHAERLRIRQEDDLRTLLDQPWGRRIVWRWLKQCHITALPIVFGEHDKTCFNLGMQNFGNTLLAEVMNINPEAYMKMVKQGKKDDELMQKELEDERRKSADNRDN